MQRIRVSVMAFAGVMLMIATTATPSAAATQAYTVTFLMEQTVQRTCPRGAPAGAFCFTGSDRSNRRTTESYTGVLDFSSPIANACPPTTGTDRTPGYPDHNVVSIGTPGGDLFVTTDGVDCTSAGTDAGTWRVVGGTRRFQGVSGGGTVSTQATGGAGTAADPIRSFSTYVGRLTLH